MEERANPHSGAHPSLAPSSSRVVRTGFLSQLSSLQDNPNQVVGAVVPLKRSSSSSSSYVKSNMTSTWQMGTSAPEEYISEKHSHYSNPHQQTALLSKELMKKFPYEQEREKLRNKAIDKFEQLAKKRYGSVEGLFAAVRAPLISSPLPSLSECTGHSSERIPPQP